MCSQHRFWHKNNIWYSIHNIIILPSSHFFVPLIGPMAALQSTSSITTNKWSTEGKTDNTTSLVKRRECMWGCVCVCSSVTVTVEGWGLGVKRRGTLKKGKMEWRISIWKQEECLSPHQGNSTLKKTAKHTHTWKWSSGETKKTKH